MQIIRQIFIIVAVFFVGWIITISYYAHRPLSTRQAEGFVVGIEKTKSFTRQNCYEITLAVKPERKKNKESEYQTLAPETILFIVCEKNKKKVNIAREAMNELKKVNIIFIDEFYPLEKKLFTRPYTISYIQIK